jgi:23S rRNA G2445 N2-methylase RlmL
MTIELEVLPGLKPFVLDELHEHFGDDTHIVDDEAGDHLLITFEGHHSTLHQLRTVVAAYQLLTFDIPRPKALLGHQTFTTITKEIHRIRSANESGAFSTFTISAAGRDSRVFRRFRSELSEATHLTYTADEADLFIRVRPAERGTGWDVLLRTTPRPLGTRAWRVADMPGALHATIAASMVRLLGPGTLLNLMSGSGTLLIEHQRMYPTHTAVGVELTMEALAKARRNSEVAGVTPHLLHMDATRTAFRTNSVARLAADLPWGHLVGEGDELEELYAATLREAHRIAAAGARFAVLTHAITLFEPILKASTWYHLETMPLFQGGLHPRLYLLEKR